MNEIQFGHGIDRVQALIQGIEGTRVFLEKSGKRLLWEGAKKERAVSPDMCRHSTVKTLRSISIR
jgi:hypothetical protein